ncbi:MAG: metallophosphoesterase [Isosphaerales bacterium]
MRSLRLLIAAPLLLVADSALVRAQEAVSRTPQGGTKAPDGPFLVKPYLQLGHSRTAGGLILLWHSGDADSNWDVEYRSGAERPWQKAQAVSARPIAVSGIERHWVRRAVLTGLDKGCAFSYRIRKSGEVIFSGESRAPKGVDQAYRFVAFGDGGANTAEQKAIAYRAFQEKPDFVMIPGDIVYGRGRISEYRENFWPVYNADQASPSVGAPLLRSTLFVAAPGNHDIATRDLERYPDGLAYFLFWDQPLNGPTGEEGSAHVPKLSGPEANKQAFLEAAGDAYPRMANFSFEYGNAHWTVLDSNPYVDWTNPELREWVERDLASAQGATWRFVAFHHPGFNSAREHYEQQQMRQMAGVFEAGRVDIVFSGHVHNYQRSYPLHFVPGPDGDDRPVAGKDGKPITRGKRITGRWRLDKSFDGVTKTRPDGVIYLITGAGGQHLYNPEQQDDPGSWQEFTHKFVSKVHSLTVADVDGATVTVRQVAADGQQLDRFVLTR